MQAPPPELRYPPKPSHGSNANSDGSWPSLAHQLVEGDMRSLGVIQEPPGGSGHRGQAHIHCREGKRRPAPGDRQLWLFRPFLLPNNFLNFQQAPPTPCLSSMAGRPPPSVSVVVSEWQSASAAP